MMKRALVLVLALFVSTGAPQLFNRSGKTSGATAASHDFVRGPETDGSVEARVNADIAALQKFRPGYEFWQNVYLIPDGSIAFGSGTDGRLLAVFRAAGDWTREGKWYDASLSRLLKGRTLPRDLDERRDYVAELLAASVGPVLHNATRGGFLTPGAERYGSFLEEWGAIYERFGVPAEIGLAQALIESGFQGLRRSEAGAVGLCQWLDGNWRYLDRLDSGVIESGNQTTQAAYCGAYISILATKYGSFIPALSAHHAGGTNVGRILVNGARLGGESSRERYFLGSELARDLRIIGEEYSDIYQSYGPRSYRYAEMIFGNTTTVERIVAAMPQQRIYAMRASRKIALSDIMKRTGLSEDEVRRFNPALVKTVPADAVLYLPALDKSFGRDVAFWHRPATEAYARVLDEFVRLHAAPEAWDQPSFEPVLRGFERRFRATETEEGAVMATVLAYVRQESMTSPRRAILADFESSEKILDLFARGVHELDQAAGGVAAE